MRQIYFTFFSIYILIGSIGHGLGAQDREIKTLEKLAKHSAKSVNNKQTLSSTNLRTTQAYNFGLEVPDFNTFEQLGGSGANYIVDMLTDSDENIYTLGYYSETISLAGETLTSEGVFATFLGKFSSQGDLLWLKNIAVPTTGGEVFGRELAMDENGNLYISGVFNSASLQAGNFSLDLSGSQDAFILKTNTHAEVQWIRSHNTYGLEETSNMGLGDDYLYLLTGLLDNSTLSAFSLDGELAWEKQFESGIDFVDLVAQDGKIALGGHLRNDALFEGHYLIKKTGSYAHGLLAQFNEVGDLLWYQQAQFDHNATNYGSSWMEKITIDSQNNIYLIGKYDESIIWGDQALDGHYRNKYIAKVNVEGVFEWVKSFDDGVNSEDVLSLQSNTVGELLVTEPSRLRTYSPYGDMIEGKPAPINTTFRGSIWAQDGFILATTTNGNTVIEHKDNLHSTASWKQEATSNYGEVKISALETDQEGKTYIYGQNAGKNDFYGELIEGAGAFIAKKNSAGSLEWLTFLSNGSTEADIGNKMVYNETNGHTYFIGTFSNPLTVENITLNPANEKEIFASCLDEKGELVYLISLGGGYEAFSVSSDSKGSSYITFDDYYSNKKYPMVKLNAYGNEEWRVEIGVETGAAYLIIATTDKNDNIYVAGDFQTNHIIAGSTKGDFKMDLLVDDEFVPLIKYNTAGELVWQEPKILASNENDNEFNGGWPGAIATDQEGNIYLNIWTINGAKFDDFILPSSLEVFEDSEWNSKAIVKLNPSGDVQWARPIYENRRAFNYNEMAVDKEGAVYIGGDRFGEAKMLFDTTVVIDTNISGFEYYSTAPENAYVAKINKEGNWEWIKTIQGNDYIHLSGFTVNNSGQLLVSGYGRGEINFGDYEMKSAAYNSFIVGIGEEGTLDNVLSNEELPTVADIQLYPNPTDGTLHIKGRLEKSSFLQIRLLDLRGRMVKQFVEREFNKDLEALIDLGQVQNGVYLFQVISRERTITRKIIKR